VTHTASRLRRGLAIAVPLVIALSGLTMTPALATAPSTVPAAGATLPLLVATPTGLTLGAASDHGLDPGATTFALEATADGAATAATTLASTVSPPAATLEQATLTLKAVDAPGKATVSATLPGGVVWGTSDGQTRSIPVSTRAPSTLVWAFTAPGEYAVSVAAEARFSGADGTQSQSATAEPVTYRFEVSAPPQTVSTPVPSTPAPSASAPGPPTSPQAQALDTTASSAAGSAPAAKQDAAVVLVSSSSSAKAGDSLTLTATVAPVGAAGFVEFAEAEKPLGRIPVEPSTGGGQLHGRRADGRFPQLHRAVRSPRPRRVHHRFV